MPESMSIERRKLLKMFGAEIVLTPAERGMPGAVEKAEQLVNENPNAFMPQQFNNPANPQIHRETTAKEIWVDSDGKVDVLVAGVGTGGTLTGCGEVLKQKNKDFKVIAVEPEDDWDYPAYLKSYQAGPLTLEESNMLEKDKQPLKHEKHTLTIDITPYEIKTLMVKLK